MKLSISKRLICCADMVIPGSRVADIGCDHGYLGIHLVKNQLATRVIACDLRKKPLARARENAAIHQALEKMEFRLGSGLEQVGPEEVDTIIFAGMGGELISILLEECPWILEKQYQLILQPQASGNDLRRWLGEHEFVILKEQLVEDSGFLYSIMEVQHGGGRAFTPGEHYVSPALLESDSLLIPQYLGRIHRGLVRAVAGLEKSRDIERLAYYRSALEEIEAIRRNYGDSNRDSTVLKDNCSGGV